MPDDQDDEINLPLVISMRLSRLEVQIEHLADDMRIIKRALVGTIGTTGGGVMILVTMLL